MRFNKRTRIAAAIAVIGALAAGGAAFTDTTGQPANQALGFGSTTINGGSITGISYQVDAQGSAINTITLTSSIDLTTANNGGPASVYMAFGGDPFSTTPASQDATCAPATYSAPNSTVVCTVNNAETVTQLQNLQILVTNGTPNGDTIG
jgi:hypothetical protein